MPAGHGSAGCNFLQQAALHPRGQSVLSRRPWCCRAHVGPRKKILALSIPLKLSQLGRISSPRGFRASTGSYGSGRACPGACSRKQRKSRA